MQRVLAYRKGQVMGSMDAGVTIAFCAMDMAQGGFAG